MPAFYPGIFPFMIVDLAFQQARACRVFLRQLLLFLIAILLSASLRRALNE